MHLLRVSVAHGLFANCVIFGVLPSARDSRRRHLGHGRSLLLFKVELALGGRGPGMVAAGFLPLLMTPWSIPAVWVAIRILDGWIEVLSPCRDG